MIIIVFIFFQNGLSQRMGHRDYTYHARRTQRRHPRNGYNFQLPIRGECNSPGTIRCQYNQRHLAKLLHNLVSVKLTKRAKHLSCLLRTVGIINVILIQQLA